MLPLKSKLTIGLLLLSLTVGCAQAPNANIPATSETAETTTTAENPATKTKVVALTSLSADILYRLDESSLVGVSGSRLIAQDPNFSELPKVSEGRTPPNLEKIVALKPDLVIGAVGFHDQVLKKLDEVGIETMAAEVPDCPSLGIPIMPLPVSLACNAFGCVLQGLKRQSAPAAACEFLK